MKCVLAALAFFAFSSVSIAACPSVMVIHPGETAAEACARNEIVGRAPTAEDMRYFIRPSTQIAIPETAIPRRYDHAFDGEVREMPMWNRSDFVEACRAINGRNCSTLLGASNLSTDGKTCVIVYLVSSANDPEYIRRHEIAHCNGWSHAD